MTRSKILLILVVIAGLMVLVWNFKKDVEVVDESKGVVEEINKMDIKFLKTSDSIEIAYDLYEVLNPKRWFVLVHMMPATKESWADFAKQAQGAGVASIAIDLRGHGQSTGGPDGYQDFTDTDHQKSLLDIRAAVDYLLEKGVQPNTVTLIGASLGANLVLKFIVESPDFKRATLLSPGLNYRGIEALPLVKKLSAGQGVWLIAADDDERSGGNAGAVAKQLYEAVDGQIVERRGTVFAKGGHGTDILKAVPELMEKLIDF